MSNDVKIDDSKLNDAINKAQIISTKMDESLQKAQFVSAQLQGAFWSGEAKDACATYLDIVVGYHKDLAQKYKKNHKILKKLEKNIKEFENSGEVNSVKGL